MFYFVCQRKKFIIRSFKRQADRSSLGEIFFMKNENYTCVVITESQKFRY